MTDKKRSAIQIRESLEKNIFEKIDTIKKDFESLLRFSSSDIQELVRIATNYIKKIEELKSTWKITKDEVEKLERRKGNLTAREKKVFDREEKVEVQEKELVELHRVLYNKSKIIKKKEKELLEKVAQIEGRERSVTNITKGLK